MKTLKIEHEYIGFINTELFNNNLTDAICALHKAIKGDFNYVLKEYPKSKWYVSYEDKKTERWVNLYSISTLKIIKLIKMNIF